MALIPLLLALPALAWDLDTLRPAAPCGGGLQLAAVPEAGTACVGVLGAWAHAPLVEAWDDAREPVVATLTTVHLSGAYTLPGRAMVTVDLPFHPYVGTPDTPLRGAAVGDLGVSAALATRVGALDLRLLPAIGLPTGDPDLLVGAGGVTASLGAGVGGSVGPVALTGEAGLRAAPGVDLRGLTLGSLAHLAAGARYAASDRAALGVELDGDLSLVGPLSWAEVPVEAHVYGEYTDPGGLRVLAGAGTGLVAGVGAPALRVVLGVGWARPVAYQE